MTHRNLILMALALSSLLSFSSCSLVRELLTPIFGNSSPYKPYEEEEYPTDWDDVMIEEAPAMPDEDYMEIQYDMASAQALASDLGRPILLYVGAFDEQASMDFEYVVFDNQALYNTMRDCFVNAWFYTNDESETYDFESGEPDGGIAGDKAKAYLAQYGGKATPFLILIDAQGQALSKPFGTETPGDGEALRNSLSAYCQ